jgi:transcriptional regulator with GAF, ATPase, and Fis domain
MRSRVLVMTKTETIAERMAHAARELQDQYDPNSTVKSAVEILVRNVPGCHAASVSLVHGPRRKRRVETPAASQELAAANDQLQQQLSEGPCLDAIFHEETVYAPDLPNDGRWPRWGPQACETTGVRSVLTCRLFTLKDVLGALSIYSREVDAFDAEAKAEGMALAAHIAIAVAAALKIDQFEEALDTRTAISQAVGVLMERFAIKPDQAFALLTRISSTENRKLRDIAVELVRTRSVGDSIDLGEAQGWKDSPG